MAEEKKNAKATEEQEINQQEAATAAGETATEDDNVITLSKPMNGRITLGFNFDKIKGATLLKCEKKAKETDSSIVVPQLSMTFQAHVAAAALGMRYDDIINLPAPDFMAVTLKVNRFLNGAE